jgi:hypothetical protein
MRKSGRYGLMPLLPNTRRVMNDSAKGSCSDAGSTSRQKPDGGDVGLERVAGDGHEVLVEVESRLVADGLLVCSPHRRQA